MPTLFVLDANAFFSSKQLSDLDAERLFTTSGIEEEVTSNNQARFLFESLKVQNQLLVSDPDSSYFEMVKKTAIKTGDLGVISQNDQAVIALALQLKNDEEYRAWTIKVVSSDYAVQNVCKKMGIPYFSLKHGTIKRQIDWGYRCNDCGKTFRVSPPDNECDVCGGKIIRSSKGTAKKNVK